MAKVSLIYPNDDLVYNFSRGETRRPPIGLCYIAAALESQGHSVSIIDASLLDLSVDDIVEQSLEGNPQFVGIGGTTPLYEQIKEISFSIKRRLPETIVIIGGPHAGALPEATLKTSAADFVCIGDGEESVLGIVNCVLNNTSPNIISSIAYNLNGRVKFTKRYRLKINQLKSETVVGIDLNKYPIPARHLLNWKGYKDAVMGTYEMQTGAVFSRGCSGKCAFCGAAGTLVRWRKLDNILKELHLIQNMGIKNVFIFDDTYTNNKRRVLTLSDRMIQEDINLNLSVQLRLDQLDKDVCDALYASGVRYVGPGIESGNEDIMRSIGKGCKVTKENIRIKMSLLKEYNWTIRCSYVMGMLNETEEQILDTINFAKELDANENAFSILVPYPDSPLWHIATGMGLVNDYMNFSKFLYYHEIGCNLSAVSSERLLELHEYAYKYVGNTKYKIDEKVAV